MMDVYEDQKRYRYITANIVTTTTKLAEIRYGMSVGSTPGVEGLVSSL